ncbi:MAG: hypothetical protein FWE08_06875, partial [Oscillospiraceae bacterium]|nr:hypothetical protein [Oscillospiraceae bacterium]
MLGRLANNPPVKRAFAVLMVLSMLLTLVPAQVLGFAAPSRGTDLSITAGESETVPDFGGVPTDEVLYELDLLLEFFDWVGITEAPGDETFFWPILPSDFPALVWFIEQEGTEGLSGHAGDDLLAAVAEWAAADHDQFEMMDPAMFDDADPIEAEAAAALDDSPGFFQNAWNWITGLFSGDDDDAADETPAAELAAVAEPVQTAVPTASAAPAASAEPEPELEFDTFEEFLTHEQFTAHLNTYDRPVVEVFTAEIFQWEVDALIELFAYVDISYDTNPADFNGGWLIIPPEFPILDVLFHENGIAPFAGFLPANWMPFVEAWLSFDHAAVWNAAPLARSFFADEEEDIDLGAGWLRVTRDMQLAEEAQIEAEAFIAEIETLTEEYELRYDEGINQIRALLEVGIQPFNLNTSIPMRFFHNNGGTMVNVEHVLVGTPYANVPRPTPTVPAAGWTFAGWRSRANVAPPTVMYPTSGNVSFASHQNWYASWSRVVTWQPNGGQGSPQTQTVFLYNSNIAFQERPAFVRPGFIRTEFLQRAPGDGTAWSHEPGLSRGATVPTNFPTVAHVHWVQNEGAISHQTHVNIRRHPNAIQAAQSIAAGGQFHMNVTPDRFMFVRYDINFRQQNSVGAHTRSTVWTAVPARGQLVTSVTNAVNANRVHGQGYIWIERVIARDPNLWQQVTWDMNGGRWSQGGNIHTGWWWRNRPGDTYGSLHGLLANDSFRSWYFRGTPEMPGNNWAGWWDTPNRTGGTRITHTTPVTGGTTRTIWARWTPTPFSGILTFIANGGTPPQQTVDGWAGQPWNAVSNPPVTPPAGWTLDGWFDHPVPFIGDARPTSGNVPNVGAVFHHTFWARYRRDITFNLNGATHTGGGALSQTVRRGEPWLNVIPPTIQAPAGATFLGWFNTPNPTGGTALPRTGLISGGIADVAGPLTFHARFSGRPMNFNANGGTGGGTVQVMIGQLWNTIAIPAVTPPTGGWSLSGWYSTNVWNPTAAQRLPTTGNVPDAGPWTWFARWQRTMPFGANGGTGGGNVTVTRNQPWNTLTIPTTNPP